MQAAVLTAEIAVPAHLPKPKAWWLAPLEPYARPDLRRSLTCLATSALAYLALWPAMYYLLGVSYWLTLLVAIPASGFLVRTFIVFHDCGHGSFLPSKRANRVFGIICGLLVYNAYFAWNHDHAGHHATSGDLDNRGRGDVETWTVSEYRQRSSLGRLGYRLMRSPFVMLTIGPLWALAIEPRIIPFGKRRRVRNSTALTNIGVVVLVTGVILLIGWKAFVEIQLPIIVLAGSAGVFLFYVQHQFEDAYWSDSDDWSYADAALKGSSHFKLPRMLRFFSGNIGLHHVHHLQPRIPNYNLQRAHDENLFLQEAPTIGFRCALKTLNLKLIDEHTGRMVTFAQARRLA